MNTDDLNLVPAEPPINNSSPPWSRVTKVIVVIFALLVVMLLIYRFQSLIGMLTMSAILAYLMEPLISLLDKRTTVHRGLIIAVSYITIAAIIIGIFSALGFASYQQISNLINLTPFLIEDIGEYIGNFTTRTEPFSLGPINISPIQIPWERISDQLLSMLDPMFSRSTTFISRFATSTVRVIFNIIFIFIISIYLSVDLPNFGNYVKELAQVPGYRADAERLLPALSRIWRAYLRGQIILGIVIFLAVWLGLTALGVNNSLALGLLGGFLEFIPNLGPIISATVAILVAFFQPDNYWGISSWQFALLVLGLMIIIQQLENNFLVPRIVGGALDLHPIVVIVSVFMGASLAGILGAVLAAPIVASLKLFGLYTWRKLFDLPPFPDIPPPDEGASSKSKGLVQLAQQVKDFFLRLTSLHVNRRE